MVALAVLAVSVIFFNGSVADGVGVSVGGGGVGVFCGGGGVNRGVGVSVGVGGVGGFLCCWQ